MKSSKRPASKRTTWLVRGLGIFLVLLAAGGGTAWYFLKGSATAKAQSASSSSPVTNTTAVTRGDLTISASGSATLVASRSVDLSFSTGGTVAEMNVKLGDSVKAGQALARLSNGGALEADVASLELQLLQAQQTLSDLKAKAGVNLATAFQTWVTAQQTYNTDLTASQRTDYARCSKEVNAKYKEALTQATDKLNELTSTNYGSDAWINAKYDYDTAQANYSYCIAYTADEKTSASSTLAVAKTAMDQAQKTYNTLNGNSGVDPNTLALDEAKIKSLETQLATAKENLAGITLTAPFDGKVVYLASGSGAIVGTDKFITIADFSHPTLDVSVDETDMDKFKVGNAATVVFDALPDSVFNGKVTQVDAQLTTSGSYRVSKGQIELDSNAAQALQSVPLGLNGTVTIISKQAKAVLLIPVTALKSLGNNQYAVMVKSSSGQLKLTTVTVGIQDSTNAVITSGLNEGDLVSTGTIQAASSSTNNSNSSNQNQGGMMPPDGGAGGPPPGN